MGWIGVNDFVVPSFCLRGIEAGPRLMPAPSETVLLTKGTLVIEALHPNDPMVGRKLVDFHDDTGWARRLRISLGPNGLLIVEMRQGPTLARMSLVARAPDVETRVRVTLTWDAPARKGLVTLEYLDTGSVTQQAIDAPPPLPAADLAALCTDVARVSVSPEVTLVAVSDAIEPVALMPGLACGTPVETDHGPTAVERLRRGDLVRTASGEYAPIRWIVTRDVPRAGSFAPVTLRAPYFGLERNIDVAQSQRMLITGVEAEYLFGESEVLAEARHLVSSHGARVDTGRGVVRYHHLLLDSHDCLRLAGAWGESLFIGRLATTPELLATTPLAGMPPSAMPRHRTVARPALREFEAVTLMSAISA